MDKQKLLSMDPYILLSIINMKLRDEFSSLEDLCSNYGMESVELEDKLQKIEYRYNEQTNQFTGI
ncbi:DUF4250 domain-containing protein [Vallitalea sediminicola]